MNSNSDELKTHLILITLFACYLVLRQYVQETNGALRHSIVLVVQCCQNTRQVTQRRHLVG